MITTIFYDLDGTLLPMDMDVFINGYMKHLCIKAAPLGFESKPLVDAVWQGTNLMYANDGSKTNEEAFWEDFYKVYPDYDQDFLKEFFEGFYQNEFNNAKDSVGYNEYALSTVKLAKELGFRQVVATNPLFPKTATKSRLGWAGLSEDMFEEVTTYENYHYTKPNTKYYEELLANRGLKADEVLMVGNDVDEDMVAATIGMKVFLLTDCIINKKNKSIDEYPHGGYTELMEYIKGLR